MLGSGLLVFVPLVWLLGEGASLGVVGAWTAALAHVLCIALVLGGIVLRGSWRSVAPLTSSASSGRS
jgi:Na+-driven multidrug efflux pump